MSDSCRILTDVPYANVADVSVGDEGGVPTISFAADPHGGPEALWFRFRIEVSGNPRALRLVLKHCNNMLGLSASRAANVRLVTRPDGGPWQRTGPGRAIDLPDGRQQMAWDIATPANTVDVAFCYPYGPPEVDELAASSGGRLQADTIGLSQGGRAILRLSNSPGQGGSRRPGIYVIARQHSGETPGSWVLDGLLRALAEAGDAAPLVWAVPLSNIDGVIQGDYGKDNFPIDLNRAWGQPQMRHETLVIRRDVDLWRTRCRPVLALDLHAPGGAEPDGSYVYAPKELAQPALTEAWISRLQRTLGPYASGRFARVVDYASRWEKPTFTRALNQLPDLASLCMETSYQSAGGIVLTIERYAEIGRRLALAVMEGAAG